MPKIIKPLPPTKLKSLKNGVHAVGGVTGLYVSIYKGKISFWILKNRKDPKKSISYSKELSLAQVRELAQRDLELIKQGKDPKAEQKALIATQKQKEEADRLRELENKTTLRLVTDKWFKTMALEGKWKNSPTEELREFHRLKKHVLPAIGNRPINTITAQDMAELFNQLYLGDSGKSIGKVLGTLRAIYSWAKISKEFCHINIPQPLNGDFIELTKIARKSVPPSDNHPALPFNEIPNFIKSLLDKGDSVSLAIAFSIITASRGKAIRLAEWKEFDLNKGIWVVPKEHDKMKASEEEYRTVFLSKQAIAFLNRLPSKADNCLLFPARLSRPAKPFNVNSINKHIHDMHKIKKVLDGIGWVDPKILDENNEPRVITQHGTARSGFATWAEDDTNGNCQKYSEQAIELCLFHKPSTPLGRSYHRNPFDSQRKELMQAWSDHCLQGISLDKYLKKP